MKLETTLLIDDKAYPLVSHDVSLRLNDAGRGSFSIKADQAPTGIVFFDAGYTVGQFHRYFIGYVESATKQSDKHYLVIAIELINALKSTTPVSLRHCLINDVFAEITKATGLAISTADGVSYQTKQVSRVNANADGFYALRACERVFSIGDFVFYQQVDGTVWCGAWHDSSYASIGNVEIDEKLFIEHQPNSAKMAPMPALRPGMVLNGKTIRHIRFKDHTMVLKWNS